MLNGNSRARLAARELGFGSRLGGLVGDFAGWYVVGFFGRRMSGEPGLLILDQVCGFFADVADGFEG
jgi:hypothetical protein